MACREDGGRDEGMIEGRWEYREKEEGGGTTVGTVEEEQYVMRFILIQGSVRGGRYLLIIRLDYLTLKRDSSCVHTAPFQPSSSRQLFT